jgi:hypothetical protein
MEHRSNADAKHMSSPYATIRLEQAQFQTHPYTWTRSSKPSRAWHHNHVAADRQTSVQRQPHGSTHCHAKPVPAVSRA